MALLSRSLIGEPVGPLRWLGIVLGFVGVLIVLRPGGDTFSAAALLPVLAALLYALAAIVRAHGAPPSGRWSSRSGSISGCWWPG